MEELNKVLSPAEDKIENPGKNSRPFALTLICIAAFIFLGLYAIFTLLVLFKSGWISSVYHQYSSDGDSAKRANIFIYIIGVALHLIALWGILLIWKLKKRGYLYFSASVLILSVYHLLTDSASIITTASLVAFIILFGAFFKKFQ